MSDILAISVSALTTRAVMVCGLALFVLLLIGWRKPARAEVKSPRAVRRRPVEGIVVEQLPTPLHQRPGPIRRVLAIAAGGALSVLIGVLTAIIISFVLAAAIIYLSNLLGS